MVKTLTISLFSALAIFTTVGNVLAAADKPPTVVELFTSQGCSSCPPADAFLAELAERQDIIAVSFHVTYWDKYGWKDPFSTSWSTDRQISYRKALGRKNLYTPQMVINGKYEMDGAKRELVANALVTSKREADSRISLTLRREADELVITLPKHKPGEALDLWLVRYDGAHETKVMRGENRGKTMVNANIARHLELLESWYGDTREIRAPLPLPGEKEGGVAIWIQEPGLGAILGAARLDLGPDA